MKSSNYLLVTTTCPNQTEANKISQLLLNNKLAACVQSTNINSQYFWEGKLETAQEVKLEIKTTLASFEAIEQTIIAASSYDCPEIIAIPIIKGSENYLTWIDENIGA